MAAIHATAVPAIMSTTTAIHHHRRRALVANGRDTARLGLSVTARDFTDASYAAEVFD
jgi:hypothetical protein